uniref:Uncharacterized protein n=1 Tax=Myoviridae sp. ctBZY1 TaxID=2825046 RepID=A0A8S5V8J3_9CAUD|nr:MAG TPA: hypothetical protein [Myoviridae sp. ctBZY1]
MTHLRETLDFTELVHTCQLEQLRIINMTCML